MNPPCTGLKSVPGCEPATDTKRGSAQMPNRVCWPLSRRPPCVNAGHGGGRKAPQAPPPAWPKRNPWQQHHDHERELEPGLGPAGPELSLQPGWAPGRGLSLPWSRPYSVTPRPPAPLPPPLLEFQPGAGSLTAFSSSLSSALCSLLLTLCIRPAPWCSGPPPAFFPIIGALLPCWCPQPS